MARKPSRPRFRRPRLPRSRARMGRFNRWPLWRVPVLALIVMGVWWFVVKPITQEQGWVRVEPNFAICGEGARQRACVVDGDTVHIGFGSDRRRIRLTGFDAPEIDGVCDAERTLALSARARLHQWLSDGPFEWDGANDPPRDQYGRELREARRIAADGTPESLADVMIEGGFASGSGWGAAPEDWCE